MKKITRIVMAIALVMTLTVVAYAAQYDPKTSTNANFDDVPRTIILQDFENCDTGNLTSALRQYDDRENQYRVGELPATEAFKSAAVVEKTGAASIEDWDPASFGTKALKATLGSSTTAQLAFVEFMPGQYDWSKFSKDFNNDGKIDGYFGFFINTEELGTNPQIEINFTMTNNDVWWIAGWANTADTEKVMSNAWGGQAGACLTTYDAFPANFPSHTKKYYVMVRLDPENFRGLSNIGVPEDNGGRIDFSAIKSVTIRVNGGAGLENKSVYLDNFFVGVNPFMDANSAGNYGTAGLTLNGKTLFETSRDLKAPELVFDGDLAGADEIEIVKGSTFELPIPTISEDVYTGEYANENSLIVEVENPDGEDEDVSTGKFVVTGDVDTCYIITYTAIDGAGNSTKKEIQAIVVEADEEDDKDDKEDITLTPTNPNTGSFDNILVMMFTALSAAVVLGIALAKKCKE